MLQTIREHTQGWIAGTIITILILSFALWGIHSYFVGGVSDSIVAKVNGVAITKEQLAVRYERLRRQMQTQYGSSNIDEASLKNRALQDLIEIEVLKQASASQGFQISDAQVDAYLESMPEFQVNGQFSLERFQEILSSTLLSTSEFLNLIMTSLLVDQPKLGILLSSFVMPNEIGYNLSLVNQERDIDYLVIPTQASASQAIVVTPLQIQAYYNDHKNDFLTPEQISIEYLALSLKDIAMRIKPTDDMLKSFYDENINAYTQPMQWKLADIEIPVAADASSDDIQAAQAKAQAMVQALQNNQPFAQVAKGYMGTLTPKGWVTLNQIPADLQQAVANLTKQQQISAPIRTSKGFVILQAMGIQDPQIQPFNAVKARIADSYIQQHAEEKFAELRDQLAELTYEHPDSLETAAKTLDLPVKTTELFTRDKGQDIAQSKKIRDAAFSDEVINLQNNSDVIQLNSETILVLRVKSHITPALLSLNDVAKQIEYKLKAQALQVKMAKLAQAVTTQLRQGKKPDEVAAENKLAWTHTGFIGRHATKVDSAILDLAFRLPNPAHQLTNSSSVVYGATRIPNGYAIVALKGVKSPDLNDSKQFRVFAEQGQNSQGLLEYDLYRQSAMTHAKVKVSK